MSMTWWPGWNSIEGAAKWGDIFFWAGFACLVLLAGCEILSKVYSWRKDTLLAMRDDLISVARDVRSKETEQERRRCARHRRDAEIASARAPQVEPDRTAPEPQFQPQLQPQSRTASSRRRAKQNRSPARPSRLPASRNDLPAA